MRTSEVRSRERTCLACPSLHASAHHGAPASPQVLLREQLSHLHALLSPPTRTEIEWVASCTGPLVIVLHYADGSSTARPKPVIALDCA